MNRADMNSYTVLVALADELDDARNNLRTIRDGLITRRINYWETSHLFDAKIGVGIDRLLAALSVDHDNITKLRDAAYDLAAANNKED
jgi:hypothetical protein